VITIHRSRKSVSPLAETPAPFVRVDSWRRYRLRQVRWKEWKLPKVRVGAIRALGITAAKDLLGLRPAHRRFAAKKYEERSLECRQHRIFLDKTMSTVQDLLDKVKWCPGAFTLVGSSLSYAVEAVLCIINQARRYSGHSILRNSAELTNAAQAHATESVRLKWWREGANPHINPETGSNPFTRVRDAGYRSGASIGNVGEIAHSGYAVRLRDTPAAAYVWWKASPEHWDEIMRPTWKDIGVGVVDGVAMPENSSPGRTFIVTFGTGCA